MKVCVVEREPDRMSAHVCAFLSLFLISIKLFHQQSMPIVHIDQGEYIVKELEALYMLKKYRTLKRRYYPDS